MKRLIKLIWWAAVLGAVAWMLRDRLVPGPETAQETSSRFAAPPTPASDAGAGDDLEAVKGIGPVYAARLAEHGISTFARLAAADAADLSDRLDVRVERIADWIDQAQALAG